MGVHWNCIVWLYVLNGTTLWVFIGIVLFGISIVYLKHTVIVHEKDTFMSVAHISIPIPIALISKAKGLANLPRENLVASHRSFLCPNL